MYRAKAGETLEGLVDRARNTSVPREDPVLHKGVQIQHYKYIHHQLSHEAVPGLDT